MPRPELTDQQKRALETRDVSVSLSAGAGCGKTHVLTERFLAHLAPASLAGSEPETREEPAELRQLIAITFTDPAAREMRSRIRAACYERIEDVTLSADARANWLRLLREIDSARVSTIHAFCTALLRSYAPEAGLDPAFGVLEQGEADVLLQEVLDEELRRRLAEQDADTLDLAAEFGTLADLKNRVALFVAERHRPAFGRWLVAAADEPARVDELVALWQAQYHGKLVGQAIQAAGELVPLAEMQRLLPLATPRATNKEFSAAVATLRELFARWQSNPSKMGRSDLTTIEQLARVNNSCNKNDWPTTDDYNAYRDACTATREAIKKCQPAPWDDAAARQAAVLGLKLLRLASAVVDAYQARKNQLGRLDFDDQLKLAHDLLGHPDHQAIRTALSSDLRLLLVDEFQDTDPLQVELIKHICGAGIDEGRLFFVGDFKQSIYRFRGAIPKGFLDLREQVCDDGRQQLSKNFRSQPGVLHFVNALFHDVFDDYVPLVACREAPLVTPAVEFLWTVPAPAAPQEKPTANVPKAGSTKILAEQARRQEAAAIAQRLRQLIGGATDETPVVDRVTNERRSLRPGDVAILFRTLGDVRYYEEALREQGLEYYLVGGQAFYAQQEVFDVLNLLRAVASSADEIRLAGALRSPFFALADESLFWLVETAGSLNAGLLANHPLADLTGEEQAKVAAAARALSHLRAIKDTLPVASLLNTALDLTGYDAVLVTEFLGERKLANLHKLIEQARAADDNRHDLNDFITQLTDYISQPPKEPLASTSAESANVIRLMTIHRAKGLEFPFVVVPDLDRSGRPKPCPAALDDSLGPLVRLTKDEDGERGATGMTLYDAEDAAAETKERQRLFYVATTRAADYLLLSSSLESLEKPKSDWTELVAAHFKLATGDYIGPLPAEYDLPQVHIAPWPDALLKPVGKSFGPDLVRMLDEAHALAADGAGVTPPHVAPIPVDLAARRQFSFSTFGGRPDSTESPGADGGPPYSAAAGPGNAPLAPSLAEPMPAADALDFGTLVHEVLARIDFGGPNIEADIVHWCEHLAPELVEEQVVEAARRAAAMISRFVTSPRRQHLASAPAIHREIEFLLPWPLGAIGGGETATDPRGRYIRGFIDCLYQDPSGNWRIIDYKTNNVAPDDAARQDLLAEHYKLQLSVYALAAEQALGTPPVELVLQLLSPGIELSFAWDEDSRQQAIQSIDQALTNG